MTVLRRTKKDIARLQKRQHEALVFFGGCLSLIFILGLITLPLRSTAKATAAKASKNESVTEETVSVKPQWQTDEKGWRYLDESGNFCHSAWMEIGGRKYYFDKNGYMATGWTEIDGKRYLFNEVGQLAPSGWTTDANGLPIYIGTDGAMATGWFTDSTGKTIYLDKEGHAVTGWQAVDGKRYYLGTDGSKVTGWQTIADKTYYFDANGVMLTLWQDIDGKKYYLGNDGARVTGWQIIETKKYHFGEDGVMSSKLTTIDGKQYYFNDTGAMQTGWVDVNGSRYYFGTTGVSASGWNKIDGGWHFFDTNGVLDASKTTAGVPVVAFTFEDGPGSYTSDLLTPFEENNVKATFFFTGSRVEDASDQVVRAHDLGMEIGNNTWYQEKISGLEPEMIYSEIEETNTIIRSLTGSNPTLLRPPVGSYDNTVLAQAGSLPLILWTLDPHDKEAVDAQTVYDAIMTNLKDGDVILLHENGVATIDAVKRLVADLQAKGYIIASVSDLAALKGVTLMPATVYNSPADAIPKPAEAAPEAVQTEVPAEVAPADTPEEAAPPEEAVPETPEEAPLPPEETPEG